jgi:hypothetical protein
MVKADWARVIHVTFGTDWFVFAAITTFAALATLAALAALAALATLAALAILTISAANFAGFAS